MIEAFSVTSAPNQETEFGPLQGTNLCALLLHSHGCKVLWLHLNELLGVVTHETDLDTVRVVSETALQ